MAGSYCSATFSCLGNLHTAFWTSHTNLCSTNSIWGVYLFSTFSPAFIIYALLDHGYSYRWEGIVHCGFYLHFSDFEWYWVIFLCAHWTAAFPPFEKCLFSSSAHFLNRLLNFWILNCVSCFYMLDINGLNYVISEYFLPFSRLSFHFVSHFLCCAKVFKFN